MSTAHFGNRYGWMAICLFAAVVVPWQLVYAGKPIEERRAAEPEGEVEPPTFARRNFPPSPWGKISTFVQIVFLCFQIGYLSGIAVAPAVSALKWLTAALAIASLADYARRITAAESP